MIVPEVLSQMAEDLKKYATTETIFGKPIEVQGTTIIPVCKMSIGYGGGGGEGEGQDKDKAGGKGMGGGAGGGVKIEPAALIIARDGDISVVGIQAKESKMDKLLEIIPKAIDKFKSAKEKGKEEEQESEEK